MAERRRITCPHCDREVATMPNGKMYAHYGSDGRPGSFLLARHGNAVVQVCVCRGTFKLP